LGDPEYMGIYSLFWISLFLIGEASWARSNCLNQCQLVKVGAEDQYSLSCSCEDRFLKGERDWQAGKSTAERIDFLKKKFVGISLDKYPEIENNSCKKKSTKEEPSLLKRKKLGLSTLSICDCVSTIENFAKQKKCRITSAGERLCEFSTDAEKDLRASLDPTLYAYQVCLIKRETYRKPEKCAAKPCEEKIPVCEQGKKLMNLADPESCCPVFSCESIDYTAEEK
jgi:hypothetical protein